MSIVLELAIGYALVCLLIAMALCAMRLVAGPSAHDRVLALDTLWMCGMLLAIILGVRFGTQVYFEVAILIALVSFVSTIAMAKFLMRGEIIE